MHGKGPCPPSPLVLACPSSSKSAVECERSPPPGAAPSTARELSTAAYAASMLLASAGQERLREALRAGACAGGGGATRVAARRASASARPSCATHATCMHAAAVPKRETLHTRVAGCMGGCHGMHGDVPSPDPAQASTAWAPAHAPGLHLPRMGAPTKARSCSRDAHGHATPLSPSSLHG